MPKPQPFDPCYDSPKTSCGVIKILSSLDQSIWVCNKSLSMYCINPYCCVDGKDYYPKAQTTSLQWLINTQLTGRMDLIKIIWADTGTAFVSDNLNDKLLKKNISGFVPLSRNGWPLWATMTRSPQPCKNPTELVDHSSITPTNMTQGSTFKKCCRCQEHVLSSLQYMYKLQTQTKT